MDLGQDSTAVILPLPRRLPLTGNEHGASSGTATLPSLLNALWAIHDTRTRLAPGGRSKVTWNRAR